MRRETQFEPIQSLQFAVDRSQNLPSKNDKTTHDALRRMPCTHRPR